jgi:glutathione S-transferase
VDTWYNNFKREKPKMWIFAQKALDEVAGYETNPPDMSKMNHPLHPMKKK